MQNNSQILAHKKQLLDNKKWYNKDQLGYLNIYKFKIFKFRSAMRVHLANFKRVPLLKI